MSRVPIAHNNFRNSSSVKPASVMIFFSNQRGICLLWIGTTVMHNCPISVDAVSAVR